MPSTPPGGKPLRKIGGVYVDLDIFAMDAANERRRSEETYPSTPFGFHDSLVMTLRERHGKIRIAMGKAHFIVKAAILQSHDPQSDAAIGGGSNADPHNHPFDAAADRDPLARHIYDTAAIVRAGIGRLNTKGGRMICPKRHAAHTCCCPMGAASRGQRG